MDISQGPVERKALGARMPTDPPPPIQSSTKGRRERKKGEQESKARNAFKNVNKCLTSTMDKRNRAVVDAK